MASARLSGLESPPPPATGPAPASSTSRRLLWGGLVTIAVAVVVGLVLIQRAATTYRDGLDVAADSAQLAADAAEPVASMNADLIDFARAAESGLNSAREVVASASTSLDQLGVAAEDDLAATAQGLASLADRVAGVLETIERFIPGNSASAAEDLRTIADGLEPVPEQLQQLGGQLRTTADQLSEVDPTLARITTTVRDLGDGLVALSPSVDQLGATADRLLERVDDARARVAVDLWLGRLLVILLGAILATGLVLAYRRD